MRLRRSHRLRAGDALQLGAAIVTADFQNGQLDFVTLDARQAEAAAREGFAWLARRYFEPQWADGLASRLAHDASATHCGTPFVPLRALRVLFLCA